MPKPPLIAAALRAALIVGARAGLLRNGQNVGPQPVQDIRSRYMRKARQGQGQARTDVTNKQTYTQTGTETFTHTPTSRERQFQNDIYLETQRERDR